MSTESIKLAIQRLLTPEEFPSNPHCVDLSINSWQDWLCLQCRTTNWRLKKRYVSTPGAKRKCKYVWRNTYECDHAGHYRDRRDENLSPGKRRKRDSSFKCDCKAKIYISQTPGSSNVQIEYHWTHSGHSECNDITNYMKTTCH
ncbi:hypothetical protein JB92DRAFT_2051687 [Gautieria morchelliformis]|nr:hypothetical protein JB92DRAFT_2051687 [Gautieria morchelliformis]